MSKSAAASSGRGGDANRRQKKANDDEDLESNYGDSADEYDLDELGRRVDDVIGLFTHSNKSPILPDDLGRIMRCLRINATQALIKEIATQYAAADGKSIIAAQLKPRLIACMQDEEFKVPNEKRLETAFRAIEAQFGQLTKEQLETCLSNDGEPLSVAEWDDMLNHLPIKKPNLVDWSLYVRDFMYLVSKKL